MSKEARIMTLHPSGKKGVHILQRRYHIIKDFILKTVRQHSEISYQQLNELAEEELSPTFDGKVSWYIVTVKLDLEARGIIERIPQTSPHRLRLKASNQWKDQAVSVRKGEELDAEALKAYLQQHAPQYSGDLTIRQFPGGASNLTYAVTIGADRLVLRRPPFGPKIKSAHDMSREYNLFTKLQGVYPKVPRPVLFCEDENVLGREFYLMERVEGVILRSKMPEGMIPQPELMRKIAHSLIATFAELHQVDYEAAGLATLGRPKGYNERQITGWTKRYFNAKTDDIAEIEKVSQWLHDHLLPESDSCLIHNDYKYDNVVLDANDWSKIIAILDWEMCTLGDPLMDLGTSICYWTNPDDPDWAKQFALSPTTLPGNPTRGEVVQTYAQLSGRDVSNILFYYVYGLFKIAVVVQQIYKRYKTGHSKDPRFATMIHAVRGLGVMAWQAIQKNRIEQLF